MQAAIVTLLGTVVAVHGIAPELLNPKQGTEVSMPLPYFNWTDAVPWPFQSYSYSINLTCTSDGSSWTKIDRVPAITNHWSPDTEIPWAHATCSWYVCTSPEDPLGEVCSMTSGFDLVEPMATVIFNPGVSWRELHDAFRHAAADRHTVTQLVLKPGIYSLCQSSASQAEDGYLFYSHGDEGGVIVRGMGAVLKIRCVSGSGVACGFFAATIGCVGKTCGYRPSRFHVTGMTIDYDDTTLSHIAGEITATTSKGFMTKLLPTYQNSAEFPKTTDGFFLTNRGSYYQRNANADRVAYTANTTWSDAAGGDSILVEMFAMKNIKKYISVGDVWLSMDRGGDLFYFDAHDVTVYNVTSLSCRGRYFIPHQEAEHARCIKNTFGRRDGLLLGAASGGINDHGLFSWYDANSFEHDRDDMLNMDYGRMVFRNNNVTGAFRNAAWLHGTRIWYHGNIVRYGGTSGIHLGGVGQSHVETVNSFVHESLISDNHFVLQNNQGIRFNEYDSRLGPDPLAHGVDGQTMHTNVVISGNSIMDTRKNEAVYVTNCVGCILERNTIKQESDQPFEPTSDAARQFGIFVVDSSKVTLTSNMISDGRLVYPDMGIGTSNSTVTCKGNIIGSGSSLECQHLLPSTEVTI